LGRYATTPLCWAITNLVVCRRAESHGQVFSNILGVFRMLTPTIAQKNMRTMRKGDLAFFYHSNCKVPGIAGVMRIVQEHSIDGASARNASLVFTLIDHHHRISFQPGPPVLRPEIISGQAAVVCGACRARADVGQLHPTQGAPEACWTG
jgi:hypothetical protein